MTTPVPGGRLDATRRAATAAAPAPDPWHEAPEPPPIPAIPVTLRGHAPALNGRYRTVTIPASTSTAVSVAQLLSYDDRRQSALIMAVDGPVIIAASLEEAQDPANIGGTYPSGALGQAGLPVTHREAVWAANPSVTAAVRVAIAVETGAAT